MRPRMKKPSTLLAALLAVAALAGCAAEPPPPAACPPAAPSDGPPWPKALDHPSTPESHRRAVDGLFEAMGIQRVLDVAVDNAIKVQLEANPSLARFEKVMRRFMAKYLSLEGIRAPMTDLYVARFSELEIVQLAAFYRTPLGERTLVELPKILEEGSRIGLTQVQEHMEELKGMIREELERGGGPGN
jgi:hypothetical protein